MMTETEWSNFEKVCNTRRDPRIVQVSKYDLALLAAYKELKERREDEEWLRKQTCYVFCYTHMDKSGCGFHIGRKCPDQTWGIGSTLNEAVEKARGYKEGGK